MTTQPSRADAAGTSDGQSIRPVNLIGGSGIRRDFIDLRAARRLLFALAMSLSEEAARDLTRAKSRILQARSFLDCRKLDHVHGTLVDAEGHLANVPDAFKTSAVADIVAIRTRLAAAAHADEVRKITQVLDRELGLAVSSITVDTDHATALLAHVAEILAADETRRVFAADGIVAYQVRADAIHARLAAHLKTER